MDPLPEPRVTLKVEGTPLDFLIDTGAEYSVLQQPLGKLNSKKTVVTGATGQKMYPWTTTRTVDLGRGQVTHSFLVIPECPAPLLGRDLSAKLKAQIRFTQEGPKVEWGKLSFMVLAFKLEDEYRMHEAPDQVETSVLDKWLKRFPDAWAETAGMGMAIQAPPVVVGLKTDATPITRPTVSYEPGSYNKESGPTSKDSWTRESWFLVSLHGILLCYL